MDKTTFTAYCISTFELEDKVDIGRRSDICYEMADLEKSRFGGNRPTVLKVTGVTHDGNAVKEQTARLPQTDDLSNSGNGRVYVDLGADGLYIARGILGTSGNIYTYTILLADNKVCLLSSNKTEKLLEKLFPAEYIAAMGVISENAELQRRAETILDEISSERATIDAVRDGDFVAKPVFSEVDIPNIVNMLRTGIDPDEYVAAKTLPTGFEVNNPVHATGSSGEKAILNAKKIIEQRKADVKEATKKAKDKGLPKLIGTPKQKAWAMKIRDGLLEKNPSSELLHKEPTAKFWIEYRNKL